MKVQNLKKPCFLVDVWGGDVHQHLIESAQFDNFEDAFDFMNDRVESGMLCNVLHTDFKAPDEKVKACEQKLIKEYILNQAKRK